MGRGVTLADKPDNLVLQRSLRLQVENKNRKQEEKLASPFLLTLLKAISFKRDSMPCHVATQRGVQVGGGLLLNNSWLEASVSKQQALTAAESLSTYSTTQVLC